jgi:hypothetical protein
MARNLTRNCDLTSKSLGLFDEVMIEGGAIDKFVPIDRITPGARPCDGCKFDVCGKCYWPVEGETAPCEGRGIFVSITLAAR